MGKNYDVYFEKLNKAVTWTVLCLSLFTFNLGFSQLSYTQNFTSGANSWTTAGGYANASGWTNERYCSAAGAMRINMYYSGNGNISSPLLGQSTGTSVNLSYGYKITQYGTNSAQAANFGNAQVQYKIGANGTWTTIQTIGGSGEAHIPSSNCATKSITFTPPAGDLYIRFYLTYSDGDWEFYVDDVVIGPPPACIQPTGATANLLSYTSANFSWNTVAGAQGYEYAVTTSLTPPTTGTAISTNTATSNTLTASTNYYLHVRSNCGANGFSSWTTTGFFTGPCIPTTSYTYDYTSSFATQNAIQNVTYSASSQASGSYSNLTSQVISQAQGLTFDFSHAYVEGNCGLNIWVDFNDNMVFEDSERVYTNNTNYTATQTGIITIPLTAPIGSHIMRVRSQWSSSPPPCGNVAYGSTLDYTLNVLPAPSCLPPTNLTVSNITKNSAQLGWVSDGALFDIEVLLDGQTPTGVPTDTSVSNSYLKTGLLPSTTYKYYVRNNCGSSTSFWVGPLSFTTMCNYPDILNVEVGDLCGYGSAEITATSSTGIVQWFLNASGIPYYTGNVFNTPNIEENTTFYIKTGSVNPGTVIQVGNGTTATNADGNPFYYSYSGYKYQYTFTAQELIEAGLSAGPINSLAFDVVTGSSVTRNNFRVYIGHTTQSTATTTHIPVTDLNLVYTNAALNVIPGINPMNFTTPFVWDGVSNIIVQTVFANGGDYNYSLSGSVRTHVAPVARTSMFYSDYATVDQFVNATTAASIASTYGYTITTRPNIYLNGVGLCSSPFIPIQVNVTPAPELTLSSTSLQTCQGNSSDNLSIVTGGSSYDTYEWYPSEGVNGNSQTGWTFNPQESTIYTLVASQSNGVCAKTITVAVDVISLGYQTLEDTYVTCSNQPLELSIAASEVDINTLPALNLLFLGLNDASNLGITFNGANTTFSHQTNLYSEGTGSIKLFPSTSASANIEINQTIDLSNSYGLLLEFDHVALLEGLYWAWDYGYVQYSTNGGNTWTTFTKNQYIGTASTEAYTVTNDMRFARDSYADWLGTMNNTKWKGEKFFLPYASNMNALKLRFVVVSDGSVTDDSWYIDNIRIKKVSLPEIEWSPATHLFVDAALTQPYAGESIGTVYFKHDASGNYPYQVSISNDLVSCATTVNTEVVIPELVFPGLTNSFYCTAIDVNDLQFNAQNGVTYNWFNSIYSQTPLDVIPFTGTYYVQVVAGDCIGSRSPVQINIIGNVNVQVNPNQSFCEGATVASLLATPSNPAATVQWFDSIDATQPLASTIVLQAGTTYYVNQVYYGCQSTKLPVNIVINQIPDPISVSELTVCSNSTIGSVVIPNNTAPLHWYASMNSTTPLSSQVILTPGTYYISTYAGVCDSQRMPVNVTIVENLAQPQVNVIDICGSGFVSDLNAYVSNAYPAAELRWYNSSTATTALSQDQVLTTGTYYVEQYLTGCTSTRKAVAVRVTSKVAPVINAQVVCEGTKIQDVVLPAVSNVIYNWYSTPTSTQALAVNTVLTTGNYYVRRLQFGCLSDPTMVSVSVLATPTPPTGNLQQVLPEGSLVSDIIMNQPGIVWYNTLEDAQNNTNPLLPNMPLENGHTYYGVLVSSNGCRSVAVAVTINLYLGLNDLDIASLKVYPNPTSDSITVSYSEAIDSVEVYSMLGQKVLDKKGANTEISLDLSHLSSGTYIIKVLVGQNSQLVKVVKK